MLHVPPSFLLPVRFMSILLEPTVGLTACNMAIGTQKRKRDEQENQRIKQNRARSKQKVPKQLRRREKQPPPIRCGIRETLSVVGSCLDGPKELTLPRGSGPNGRLASWSVLGLQHWCPQTKRAEIATMISSSLIELMSRQREAFWFSYIIFHCESVYSTPV